MNKSILSLTLALSLAASTAQAEVRRVLDRANLNLNAQGSIARQAETRLPQNIVRDITRTDARGETASRNELTTRDGEAGLASSTLSGVTADGQSYAAEGLVETAANGLTLKRNADNSEANSGSGSANVLIDKEADTLNNQLDLTPAQGGGESASLAGEGGLARADDGFADDTEASDSQGNTHSRSVDAKLNKQEGKVSKEVKASGPNGQANTSTVIARNQSAAE